MVAGELYNAMDAELVALRRKARRLTREYNATTEDDIVRRTVVLKALFGRFVSSPLSSYLAHALNRTTDSLAIEPPFFCDYGCNIKVGNNFYMNFDCVILDCAMVEIGDNVLCGPKVS